MYRKRDRNIEKKKEEIKRQNQREDRDAVLDLMELTALWSRHLNTDSRGKRIRL